MLSAVFFALLVGGARAAGDAPGLIAFARADGIYVMHADGSGMHPLRRGGAASSASGLAWSPDGRTLAFVAGTAIWAMDANGGDLSRLVVAHDAGGQPSGWLSSPTWAPDGRRIAFTAGGRYYRDIWVMGADGSDPQRLAVTKGYNETEIDWDPRGGRIAFSGAGWVTEVWLLNTNGSSLRSLTWDSRWREGYWWWEGLPSWSPDGSRIVFTPAILDTQRTPIGRSYEIAVMDDGGGSRVRLTQNTVADWEPDWSPDGNRIAFVRATVVESRHWNKPEPKPHPSSEIYVMNADGTGVTRLTDNRIADTSPAWQPVASS